MKEERNDEREGRHAWPPLPFAEWQKTQHTLHLWTQVVGKVKLELTPFLNEWWNVALQITPRGLTSGPIPYGLRIFTVDFDFVDHLLLVRTSDGEDRTLPLVPRSVASFYSAFFALLKEVGLEIRINPMPVEIVGATRLDLDHENDSYDAEAVNRWWRILLQCERVLQRFRTPFVGKSSPIQFFWGSFDLSHTRFNGRPASLPPEAPRFMRLAEDQENYACGFWPGNANYAGRTLGEPAFYAYIFPEPAGFPSATVLPEGVSYHPDFGQYFLPYEFVRRQVDPDGVILSFLQSTYDAAADLAGWDRASLEVIYD
jgi:hypothetical protein